MRNKTGLAASRVAAIAATLALTATACAVEDEGGSGSAGGGGGTVDVGVITSTSGLLSSYGNQFKAGFEAGLDYATDGSGEVDGTAIDVTYADDATDPAQGVTLATEMIGEGTEIITGPVSSGVSAQVAPLAEQNDILYISGAAASDALTGINANTFRSGRQTYQDVLTAEQIVGDVKGKKVVVFAQDYEFGQANVSAVTSVLGDAGGATVKPVLAPVDAADFTPFARQVIDEKPDLVFVAWAGETTNAMWKTLSQQGVFDDTTVVTGLAERASFDDFGPAATKITFLSHYFAEATDTEANQALVSYLEESGEQADIFHNDGFVAAQMVVRAVSEGEDVQGYVDALEGWSFTGPKGETTVRESDHALIQPMFIAELTDQGGSLAPQLVETVDPAAVAPPE